MPAGRARSDFAAGRRAIGKVAFARAVFEDVERFKSRTLYQPQVSDHGARVLAREAENGHIVIATHEAPAQTLLEIVEIDARIEMAKRRRTGLGADIGVADRVALRAEPYCKSSTAPLGRAERHGIAGCCGKRENQERGG